VTRSWLYVPGDRPDRFAKATASGADAVILDLEDAVPPAGKDDARRAVAGFLEERAGEKRPELWVRVNAGEPLVDDVREVLRAGPRGISLPKVSSPADVERLDVVLGEAAIGVVALVETAAGVLDARAIAAHPRVERLAIGEVDLSADLGISSTGGGDDLATARGLVVLASAAAGIEQPVGPIATDYADMEALRRTTEALKRMGFGSRAAIHPAQVGVINEVFTPTSEEVRSARALLEAYEAAGGRAFAGPDGRMVDEAVVRAARRTLSLARE
jgi:citrate lyase subunit beta/citryl-CoA lyase